MDDQTIPKKKQNWKRQKKRTDKIDKLIRKKGEERINLSIMDNEVSDLLLEIDNHEKYTLKQLSLAEIKLKKLKVSERTIKAIKSQFYRVLAFINNIIILILKLKSLIVCINYTLLGFYLCHFERYECVKKLNCV